MTAGRPVDPDPVDPTPVTRESTHTESTYPTSQAPASGTDALLRDYHDARRREDQWRIPQLLTALATPLVALITALFALGGQEDYAAISAAVTIVTGAAAALLAIEVWRWHRTAIGIGNSIRTDHPADAGLLLKDPL